MYHNANEEPRDMTTERSQEATDEAAWQVPFETPASSTEEDEEGSDFPIEGK